MEVLIRNEVIQDLRKQQPQSRAVVGDVARLESGRLVARYMISHRDGTAAFACRDYRPDQHPHVLQGGGTPKDWGQWMDNEIERGQGRYRRLGPRDFVPAAEPEFADFRKQFPHTAAFIGLPGTPARAGLFDVGLVHYPIGEDGFSLRRVLDEHAGGLFGEYGVYDDAPLSEEELWTLAEQPILSQNRAAIASKYGPVLSRYLFPAGRGGKRQVDVVTVLAPAPRGPRTLLTVEYLDAA